MTSRRICTTRAAAACAAIALMVMASPGSASASVDQCVRKKAATGMDTTKAMAECLKEAANPSKTTPPVLTNDGGSDSGGASTGLLVLVGLGGIALGATAMTVLRKPSGAPSATPPAQPAPSAAPPGMPQPGFAAPGTHTAATVDRSRPLVATLIDLSDRVSSGALRAEILAALTKAGVQMVEPAQGMAFDATQMRGVGSAPAPDPGWVGRVASTERAGFVDAGAVVRLPDVVVYTAGD